MREESGREEERETETSICWCTYLYIHWLILSCALTLMGDRTHNLGVLGWRFSWVPGQGILFILLLRLSLCIKSPTGRRRGGGLDLDSSWCSADRKGECCRVKCYVLWMHLGNLETGRSCSKIEQCGKKKKKNCRTYQKSDLVLFSCDNGLY